MTRNIANRYTTIERLIMSQGENDVVDACDPTGGGSINDCLVQERLWDIIYSSSREVDAYLIKHMPIPIPEVLTALTVGTSVTMTYGSVDVVGVGTAFDTELEDGDEIYLPDETFWFGVVDSVTDALNLVLKYAYCGETTVAAAATLGQITIPGWLEIHTRNYALYNLWRRRGRINEHNPWYEDRESSRKGLIDFQKSKQKFDDGGIKRKHNPVQAGRTIEDRIMTETSLEKYVNPDTYPT